MGAGFIEISSAISQRHDSNMPRRPRYSVPGIPLHIIQRGNNRQKCFVDAIDFQKYLQLLFDAAENCAVEIHAWVLMSNHVHILATPTEDHAVSRMMQKIGAGYVNYFNKRHTRTGTLWEGRFRSSMVDSTFYCLACYRYIELNPVRALMVNDPSDYPWSSHGQNTGLNSHFPLTPHKVWMGLGHDTDSRQRAYRKLVATSIPKLCVEQIRFGIRKGLPTGDEQFRSHLEDLLSIRFGDGQMGRPKSDKKGSDPFLKDS